MLDFAAKWIEQQMPIATLHHRCAVADQPNCSVAQIVSLPTAFGDTVCAEQRLGDIPIARVVGSTIQSTQSEDQAIPAGWRKGGYIFTWQDTTHSSPKSEGGRDAVFEEHVESQIDGQWLSINLIHCMRAKVFAVATQHEVRLTNACREQRRQRHGEFRLGELGR